MENENALLKTQKKLLVMSVIRTVFVILIAGAIALSSVLVISKLNQASEVIRAAGEKIGEIDVAEANRAVDAAEDVAANLKELDIDHFNELVTSLTTISKNLSSASESISTVAEKIRNLFR